MELPSYPGYNDALWETLLELADRQRLRAINELADPAHPIWEDLPEDAADRARLAYQILVGPPTG